MNPALLQKQPWLIAPEAIVPLFDATRAFFEQRERISEPPASALLKIEEGIAQIEIFGPMLRKPDLFDSVVLGACDTEALLGAIEEAAEREDVQAIFLDIDSPGGSVNGTPELARSVARASKKKYVYAFTAGQMCSAAYWVASQADAIYASPSARIGSIGVILPVVDSTGAFAQAGLKIEVFAAGKFKATGTPGTELTGEQRDWLQSEVEETFEEFRAAVLARGRKIPDEAMEGQTFSARKAMRLNLAGMVESREEALGRLRQLHVRAVDTEPKAMSAPSIESELATAREHIARLEADAQAREGLLSEAEANLQNQIEAAKSEAKIEAEALIQVRSELDATRLQLTELHTERASLQEQLKAIAARNATLESAEQDLEKRASERAAQIIAETGTPQPAQITPKGDNQAASLVEQFRAITDPKEQTAFWRSLNAQQQAQILATSQI